MHALRDVQQAIRQAVVAGFTSHLDDLLVGGKAPIKRLAIHRRHYQSSLLASLQQKFPATVWLVGSGYVTDAASQYIREFPPKDPCIAAYGLTFPQYLGSCPGSERLPYLQDFAELEWQIGQVSIAINYPAIPLEDFASVIDVIGEMSLTLQSGARYLQAHWPVDELMRYFLGGDAPDQVEFSPSEVRLEIRGARGEFYLNRLDAAHFIFRRSISEGNTVGAAAERALESDPAFQPGAALAGLFAAGLVAGPAPGTKGDY